MRNTSRRRGKLIGGALFTASLAAVLLATMTTTSADTLSRIGGGDRYNTSSRIANNVAECTPVAVLVSGNSYADALSANYLAGALYTQFNDLYTAVFTTIETTVESSVPVVVPWELTGVPVLLVEGDTLPYATAQYLNTAGVGFVYIVGGTAAVSAGIEAQLSTTLATNCDSVPRWMHNQKIHVTRIDGMDRYETNRAVVNFGSTMSDSNRNLLQLEFLQSKKHTAIVATGEDFADAMAVGPAAYNGLPLILTDGVSLSDTAMLTLTDNDIAQVIIIGGTEAVSSLVRTQIADLGIHVERIAGEDRYATATAWADFMSKGAPTASIPGAFDGGLGWTLDSGILLASGTNFADALPAGPLSAIRKEPIILTDPTVLSINTKIWLIANKATLSKITVLGLGGAVSTSVMNAAGTAIN